MNLHVWFKQWVLCYIHTMHQLTWAVLGIQPALFGVFAYVCNALHAKEQSKIILN